MTLVERIEGLEASVASLAAEAASLRTNDEQQADRIRHLEKASGFAARLLGAFRVGR